MKTKQLLIAFLVLAGIALFVNFRGEDSPKTKVFNCAEYVYEPTELVLYCADAGQILQDIKWDDWSDSKAVGTATVTTNLCEPNCAAGNTETTSVEVELIDPKDVESVLTFSKVRLTYEKVPGSRPNPELIAIATTPLS